MKTSNFPKSPPALKTFALILAGGLADRMGGEDKGLALLEGRPLIDRVIGKIRPQVSHIVISANRNLEEYARRSPHVFPDARQWQHFGPLSALCTAANDLQLAAADWLLIVPCDMPYLPDDLVARFECVLCGNAGNDALQHYVYPSANSAKRDSLSVFGYENIKKLVAAAKGAAGQIRV